MLGAVRAGGRCTRLGAGLGAGPGAGGARLIAGLASEGAAHEFSLVEFIEYVSQVVQPLVTPRYGIGFVVTCKSR